jgi:hypothetical protein
MRYLQSKTKSYSVLLQLSELLSWQSVKLSNAAVAFQFGSSQFL